MWVNTKVEKDDWMKLAGTMAALFEATSESPRETTSAAIEVLTVIHGIDQQAANGLLNAVYEFFPQVKQWVVEELKITPDLFFMALALNDNPLEMFINYSSLESAIEGARAVLELSVFNTIFNWTTRARNVLEFIREDYKEFCIRDLVLLTPAQIKKYRNAGDGVVNEIQGVLIKYGLKLSSSTVSTQNSLLIRRLESQISRLERENDSLKTLLNSKRNSRDFLFIRGKTKP